MFYLGWASDDFVTTERKEGFVEACAGHNCFYRYCPMRSKEPQKNIDTLMSLDIDPDRPVVMIAGSCNMTGAALRMASGKGLKLWDNFFYADFDNVDSLERTGVQVTTAIQDYYTMGVELLKAVKNLNEKPVRKFIPHKIEGLFE